MHWLEGVFIIFVGAVPWLIASDAFPRDAQQRVRLERAMPFVRNRLLMRGAAIFLWLFGGAVAANSLFDLGLPL
jgi:hypothetical protein